MADLITLNELLAARGETAPDAETTAKYNWMIGVASSLVRLYTGRDFGSTQATEERTFQYDGSGYLDIDDASAITAVKFVDPTGVLADQTLNANQWFAQPSLRDDAPVYWYLVMPGAPRAARYSPEMGFTWNADVYYAENRFPSAPQMVKVTGTWGWPTVPVEVKQAAIWAIEDWLGSDSGEDLTSEAIAGYSRSWSRDSKETAGMALPRRSLDVLAAYAKTQV